MVVEVPLLESVHNDRVTTSQRSASASLFARAPVESETTGGFAGSCPDCCSCCGFDD